MPIPQGVPISFQTLTDPMPFPVTQPIRGNAGPFQHGGATYSICLAFDGSNETIVAFKSIDQNATSPLILIDSLIQTPTIGTVCCFYDRIGTVVYIAYVDLADGKLKFITFNISTGTFLGVRPSTVIPSNPFDVRCINIGTKVYIAWQDGTASVNLLYYDGASFAANTVVAAAGFPGVQLFDITLTSDASHIAIWHGEGLPSPSFIKYSIASGATVVSTVTAQTFPVLTNAFVNEPYTFFNAYYDSTNDISALTLPMYHNVAGFPEFQGLVCATTSLSPSFSFVDVADFAAGDTVGLSTTGGVMTGNYAGTLFYIFWHLFRSADSHSLIQFSTATSLAGPWSARTTYYDLQNSTPTPPPHLANDSAPESANFLADDTLNVLMGLDYHVGTTFYCGLLFTWPFSSTPPTPQTLQLNKVVVGGSASPSDFLLTAMGNDSPVTVLSGPGPQVGPTAVPAITFDLSEGFGPTWNSATGTWAANSTPWNGGYVAGAWVCTGGGSMPNDHTIIVPTGATIVCTITNTAPIPPPFNPTPCSGIIPPAPSTDVQFELRRVYASMKPAPRIPVRGGTG